MSEVRKGTCQHTFRWHPLVFQIRKTYRGKEGAPEGAESKSIWPPFTSSNPDGARLALFAPCITPDTPQRDATKPKLITKRERKEGGREGLAAAVLAPPPINERAAAAAEGRKEGRAPL